MLSKRILCAVLSGSLSLASVAGATEVTVNVRGRGTPAGLPKDFPVRGLATWFGDGKVGPVNVALSTSEPAVLNLRPGRWELRAEAAGYWGPPYSLDLSEKATLVPLDLWPAGVIEGGFQKEAEIQSPAEMALFFRPSPGKEGAEAPPSSKAVCPVEREMWKCIVPAGELDLRFQATGFVPRYLWGVRVGRGETVHPGRLDLKQGSAVLGWVVTADRSPLAKDAKVTLRPRIGGRARDEAERQRLDSLRFESAINAKGFFQIDGVPPGAYILEARQDKFAPATASVRVVPNEVTEVANPPLVLDYPKVLEVFVDPPAGPSGQLWQAKLQQLDRDSSFVQSVAEEAVSPDGSWKKTGIAPGRYLLRIGLAKNAWWWLEEVVIDENPAPIQVRMDTVRVEGTVSLGKRPVAGTVYFGGRFGAVKIEALSDEKGRFETLLPRSGAWPVHVSAKEPLVEREFPKIQIEPKPGTDLAVVDLRLPDTWLRGHVRIEGGGPASKAIVTATSRGDVWEGPVQVWADEEGYFELRGLPQGSTLLEADAGKGLMSDPVVTELREGADEFGVVLYARPRLRVQGTVFSSAGPVVGARVKAAPAGFPYIGAGSVSTDPQGRFELRLPAKTREIFLSVAAPGFAFRSLRLPVAEGQPLPIGLDQQAGTLVIEPEEVHDLLDPTSPKIYLLHGGAVESLHTLLAWAGSASPARGGGRAVIPGLEPGDYQVCQAFSSERPALDFGILPQGSCAAGSLQANGELTLRIPGRKGADP